MRKPRRVVPFLVVVVAACSIAPPPAPVDAGETGNTLFSAAGAIQDGWQHLPLRGTTEYRLSAMDGRLGIRAVGRESASGLIRRIDVDWRRCPVVEWSWAVTRMQPDADLRVKEAEDVAASVFLLFGDPGFLSDPRPVPTLRYTWTNNRVPVDAVVDNPYLPGIVRSVVVESGDGLAGTWVTERRNVVRDFGRAFGRAPTEKFRAIALFTDNDQTRQPVEAYYGSARAVCAP